MSRFANDGVARLSNNSGGVGTPLSLSLFCWFKQSKYAGDTSTFSNTLIANWGAAGSDYNFMLQMLGSSAVCQYLDNVGSGHNVSTGIGSPKPGFGGWHSIGSVYSSNVSARCFGNGKIPQPTAVSYTLHSSASPVHLASRADAVQALRGHMAHAAIWLSTSSTTAAVLTVEEMHALMRGANPMSIRRSQLWSYWPLHEGDLNDVIGNRPMVSQVAPVPGVGYDPQILSVSPVRDHIPIFSGTLAFGSISAPAITSATSVFAPSRTVPTVPTIAGQGASISAS